MITIITDSNISITQNDYDSLISAIPLGDLVCSCGATNCMHIHGYYKRTVRASSGRISLRVCRVRCSKCRVTHTLFPSYIVPYSQVTVSDQRSILIHHLKGNQFDSVLQKNLSINESDVRHIIRMFRNYWQYLLDRLLLLDFLPTISLKTLITECLSRFRCQFMQNKKIDNIEFDFRGLTT